MFGFRKKKVNMEPTQTLNGAAHLNGEAHLNGSSHLNGVSHTEDVQKVNGAPIKSEHEADKLIRIALDSVDHTLASNRSARVSADRVMKLLHQIAEEAKIKV